MKSLLAIAILSILLPSSPATAEDIEIWTRGTGDYTRKAAEKTNRWNLQTVKFKDYKLDVQKILDIQYNKKITVKVVSLKSLLQTYLPRYAGMNLVVLHFSNGMVFPLQRDILKRAPDIQIAVEMKQQNGKWSRRFPPAGNIRFIGSKVVADPAWLKAFHKETKFGKHHSPFRHMGTLQGVEFADGEAYFAQFRVKGHNKTQLEGRLVYFDRCQFCHGVRGIGADYGPDFAKSRKFGEPHNKNIYNHLKGKTGVNMPPQPDIKPKEVRAVARWLRTIRQEPLSSYKPFYEKFFLKP